MYVQEKNEQENLKVFQMSLSSAHLQTLCKCRQSDLNKQNSSRLRLDIYRFATEIENQWN